MSTWTVDISSCYLEFTSSRGLCVLRVERRPSGDAVSLFSGEVYLPSLSAFDTV